MYYTYSTRQAGYTRAQEKSNTDLGVGCIEFRISLDLSKISRYSYIVSDGNELFLG